MSSSYSVLQSIVETSCTVVNKTATAGWYAGGALKNVATTGYQGLPFRTISTETKGNKKNKSSSLRPSLSTTVGLVTSSGAGASAALVAAPTVASAVGFTTGGIAAGSTAAGMMSAGAVGGVTSAGSVVATLQAVGATSTIFVSAPAVICTAGVGIAVGAAGYGAYRAYRYIRG